MRRLRTLLLALALAITLALASPVYSSGISLEGLSAQELAALRDEADSRLRLLRLPDIDGYLDVLDGEDYARAPRAHTGERVRLEGEVICVDEREDGFEYLVSLDSNPGRVFLVRHRPEEGESLLLCGDWVTAYGVFEGLSPFSGGALLKSGAPVVRASLVVRRFPEQGLPAADPYTATREDPAPIGVRAVTEGSFWTDYASLEIEMVSACRGTAAYNWAQDLSRYNITPSRTQEFLFVWVRIKALSTPHGKVELDNDDFRFVSAEGAEYPPHYLLNATEPVRSLYEGGERVSLIACLIDKEDRPLVVFQPTSGIPLWFDPNRRQVLDLADQSFPELQQGDSAEAVARMKALLTEMGFLKKVDTGNTFTRTLRTALADYQKAMGLKATGIADENTQRLLLSGTYPP